MLPPVIAWLSFVIGLVLIGVDVARLQVTGLAVLGLVALLLWAYLLGVFTRAFWAAERPRQDAPAAASHAQEEAIKREAWR